MSETDNERFVYHMKRAWQRADGQERETLFNILEKTLGTQIAIELRSLMQESF